MTTTTTPTGSPPAEGTYLDTASPSMLALKDAVPFGASLAPFALAIGSAAAASGLSLIEVVAGAGLLLAGAAQLTSIELHAGGAGPVAILATVALMNARFALYGAGLGAWFTALPMRHRMAMAFAVVDVNYLLCDQRFATMIDTDARRRYYATITAALIVVFVGGQVVGYHIGAALPDGLGLHLAAPLAFGGMLAKGLGGRPQLVTAAVAAAGVLALTGPLGGAALLIAALLALLVGAAVLTTEES